MKEWEMTTLWSLGGYEVIFSMKTAVELLSVAIEPTSEELIWGAWVAS